MRTPEQATDEARTRLEKRWHLAITDTASADWPFRIPLGTPPKALLERDFKPALTWARTWQEWAAARHLALDWRNRIVTGTTQPLPTHVTIPDADTAARLCGGHWPRRLTEARRRLALVRNAFPDADHPRVIRGAESLSDVDFQLLLDAARWFTTNSATGLTPRQVPLPGFHGKWLNRNQPLIQAENLSDCDCGIARYWLHMILPISMVTCAFATIGIIETANVRLINLHLIEVVLNADLPRIWNCRNKVARKRSLAPLMLI